MSYLKTKRVQLGDNVTASNNFVLRQPDTADGTMRISNGIVGAETDLVTVTSAGNVGVGTSSPSGKLDVVGDIKTSGEYVINSGTTAKWTIGQSSDELYFYSVSSGTERMRIDSAGNVGIGTNNPLTPFQVKVATNNNFLVQSALSSTALKFLNDGGTAYTTGTINAGSLIINADSGGEVGINTTYTGGTLNVLATGSDTANWCQRYFTTGTANELYIVDFMDYQGQRMGYITGNAVGNTVAYQTSSDYRLKENVDYTWDATTRLKQLKPARFNWIRDESNTLVDGFLAHEVEDIIPEAISGEKDATETKTNAVLNSYGNYIADNVTEEEWLVGKEDGTYDADTTWAASHTQDIYQGIDQAKLVPLLTKALQEQQTIIESLEARITALES